MGCQVRYAFDSRRSIMAHRNDAMSQKQNSDRTSLNTILGFSRVKLPYEEVLMFQTVSRLLPEVSLILVTAVATHLVMSCADADALQARPPSKGRQIFPQSYQF